MPSAQASAPQVRAGLLNGDRRMTILCGSGCAKAHNELRALGERPKAPMVHAMVRSTSNGIILTMWGMTGLIGFSSGC
jgi:pyruvate dehydrogenase (quinone)